MDSTLWRLIERGDSEDEVAVILRLAQPGVIPPGVRLVSQIGEWATARLKRGSIKEVRDSAEVISEKGSTYLVPDVEPQLLGEASEDFAEVLPSDERRPDLEETGRGVLVGVVDWGMDFAHPDFRNNDGSTRLLAMWDQRPPKNPNSPEPYRYGTVYNPETINGALRAEDPYIALGYHPADADPEGAGSHGTHVAGIAVGNGRSGGPLGIAPDADLIFVHLSTWDKLGAAKIGDSVTLLEAVDFITRAAGDRPCVINLSMGRCAGSHDGKEKVEQWNDALLRSRSGLAICQSSGNYRNRRVHASGQLRPGEKKSLIWEVDAADVTPNELDIWYSGRDAMAVEVESPGGDIYKHVATNERSIIGNPGQELGEIYHRTSEPNNLDNHIQIYLNAGGPTGDWRITLIGEDIVDGRFDAWIERDAGCPTCQSRFREEDAVSFSTTGTICNGMLTIAVGATDANGELAPFSSIGPTRDGRVKPDIVAPGVIVISSRSGSGRLESNASLVTRKSGTSMAAPHVTGCVALMFQAARRPLRIEETRKLLLSNAKRVTGAEETLYYFGSGYLDIEKAVRTVRGYIDQTSELPEDTMKYGDIAMSSEEYAQDNLELKSKETSYSLKESASKENQAILEEMLAEEIARITSGSIQFQVRTPSAAPEHTANNLDDALKFAFSHGMAPAMIMGNLLTSSSFQVFRGISSAEISATLPSAIDVDVSFDLAAIVLSEDKVYFPSDPRTRVRRWVVVPRLRDFYDLPQANQAAHRNRWIDRLARASIGYDQNALNNFSMPALRILLAHFATSTIPVLNVNRPDRHFLGARTQGVTLPLLQYPLAEPECYLSVIAEVEGRLECINAYDLGAGISIGTIQLNAIRSAIFEFLWNLWEQDRFLFNQELGTPLLWSMQRDGDHYDLLINAGTPQQIVLHGRPGDVSRNYGYFQSGTPGNTSFNQIDQAFRQRLTEHIRKLAVWPHVQEIIIEVSAWWLMPGLNALHNAGIPRLSICNPDRDTFILKAMLLSSFVRYSGYLVPIVNALSGTTISEKLNNWEGALSAVSNTSRREVLRQRLRRQRSHAENVYQTIVNLRGQDASRSTSPQSSTESFPEEQHIDASAGFPRGTSEVNIYVSMPVGPFGSLMVNGTSYRYTFTPEDALWTARLIAGEMDARDDLEIRLFLKAKIDRYALFARRFYPTFHQFIRISSIPLQPVLKNRKDARRIMRYPDYIRTGGYYPNTNIPKGNLERYFKIQQTPWSELPQTARSLAERYLKGEVPNSYIDGEAGPSSTLLLIDQASSADRLTGDVHIIPSDENTESSQIYDMEPSEAKTTLTSIETLEETARATPNQRSGWVREETARTNPEHWFLSEAEIREARGGGVRGQRTLAAFTSNNLVVPLVDGEEFMRSLREDLAATNRGDFIHFTAWRMDSDLNLIPGTSSRTAGSSTVGSLWSSVIRRGVITRMLLYRPQSSLVGTLGQIIGGELGRRAGGELGRLLHRHYQKNSQMRDLIRQAGGEAILDARFPSFGSHHQKSAIIKHGGETVAYCGGLDLAADRWDTREHNSDSRRGPPETWHGWHDVQAKIRGPAVLDIEKNFRDRWNDTTWPSILADPQRPPTRITMPMPPIAASPGTHHVQVLRTYACASSQYPTFAPRGEFTYLAGYRKAISRATNYIYIEDQYLVFDEIASVLARALNKIHKLIIVVPQRTDGIPQELFYWRQNNFLTILRATYPRKVHIYDLIQPATGQPIYVHSKVMIIDDIYAVIGSANVNRRSMTYDTEMGVAVVDSAIEDDVCRFARDLRRNLWGEHLNRNRNDPLLANPIRAADEWERQANAGSFRVRPHSTLTPQLELRHAWNRVDPNGRC